MLEKRTALVFATAIDTAYAICHSLFHDSQKWRIILAKSKVSGSRRDKSKIVDEVIYFDLPDLCTYWRTDLISSPILPEERRFIDQLKTNCIDKSVGIIFANCDYVVSLLAKARQEFIDLGVACVTPSMEMYTQVCDKFHVVKFAQEFGVPVPKTILPKNRKELDVFLSENNGHCFVKRRFSTGSAAVMHLKSLQEVDQLCAQRELFKGDHIFQEFIPGIREPSANAFFSPKGELLATWSLEKLRYLGPSHSTAIRITKNLPEMDLLVKGLELNRYNGIIGVQFKTDSRTNKNVLIECNPRLGYNSRMILPLALKYGINIIAILGESFLSEKPLDQFPYSLPSGLTALSFFDDAMLLPRLLRSTIKNPSRARINNIFCLLKSMKMLSPFNSNSLDAVTKSLSIDSKFALISSKNLLVHSWNLGGNMEKWGKIES